MLIARRHKQQFNARRVMYHVENNKTAPKKYSMNGRLFFFKDTTYICIKNDYHFYFYFGDG